LCSLAPRTEITGGPSEGREPVDTPVGDGARFDTGFFAADFFAGFAPDDFAAAR